MDNTQFSIAVHVLVGVARYGQVSSCDLAGSVNANPVFIKRIIGKLAKSGLVVSSRGRLGGNQLARAAKDISLLDVYRAVNAPSLFAVHQYPKVASCVISLNIQEVMNDVLARAQLNFERELGELNIQQMLDDVVLKNRLLNRGKSDVSREK